MTLVATDMPSPAGTAIAGEPLDGLSEHLKTSPVGGLACQTAAPRRLYDARDMQSILNVSEASLKRLRTSGRIPSPIKLGGCVRWIGPDVDQWVAGGCLPPRLWKLKQEQTQKLAG